MTNTLHRQGTRESLEGDFVIFAHAATGYNKEGCGPRMQEFLRLAMRHDPANLGSGDFRLGRANFVAEWLRDRRTGGEQHLRADLRSEQWEDMIQRVTDDSGAYAVFDSREKLAAMVEDLKRAELGISVCVSGLMDEVDRVLRQKGLVRHSVEHSLGFHGQVDNLPNRTILEVSTMCGHGMVSFNLAKRVIDGVKLGQITPERGAQYLAKPCTCGVFNPARACKILQRAQSSG